MVVELLGAASFVGSCRGWSRVVVVVAHVPTLVLLCTSLVGSVPVAGV